MHLAWAGPWNDRSAIAEFGVHVVGELTNRGHVVEVWRTEVGAAALTPPRNLTVPVRLFSDLSTQEIENCDAIIANFGDHYPFHGALLPTITEWCAVGIFHDSFLGNLAAGWAASFEDRDSILRELVRAGHGKEAWPDDDEYWGQGRLEQVVKVRPMLDWFAGPLSGAVVHATHYEARVRSVCPGPVKVIGFAQRYEGLPQPLPITNSLQIATVGVGNANKRIDQVIRAVAMSPRLRQCCRFVLIGQITTDEKNRLVQLAESLGVVEPVFTGWVSEEELRLKLTGVNVMACLRHPITEGASASLLLALQSGRPTLVSNHGVFAEVPGDCVLKCEPGHEEMDVRRHLEWILDHPGEAMAMGGRARAYSLETHSPKHYVDALLPLLTESISSRPGITAGIALGRMLASFGLEASDPAVDRIGADLNELMGL